MENKYYIPTTEELLEFIISEKYIYGKVVGGSSVSEDAVIKLKFPDEDLAGGLVKFIETCSDILDTQVGYCINPEVYRIKYLDSEDIESLGLERDFERMYGDYKLAYLMPDKFCLDYFPNTSYIYISDLDGDLFRGTIKNKSELKKLLTQLGVLRDGKV